MQSQRYAQVVPGFGPLIVAAALTVGAIGGYAFRATSVQLAPAVANVGATNDGHTTLVPRSVREGEAARTPLIPRSVREGEAADVPMEFQTDPTISR